MFSPTVFHIPLKVPVEPVKWMPPSAGLASATRPTSLPLPGTKLITPSGSPASRSTSMKIQAL